MFNYYYYSAEIDTSNLYIYKNLGASYKNIGDFSSSIHFFFLAINECKILDSFNKMKYNYQEASLEKDLGIVYKMEKKYDSSSLHFLKAYTIYKFLGGTTMLDCQLLKVDIELNSARIYSSKNDLKNSEKSFLNALDIIKSLESINIKVPQKTIADITSELVEIFVIEQNFDQAEFYSLKILKIYEKEVCENYIVCEGFVITENNLGTIYSLKKKYTRAEIFYLRAIKNYQLIRKNDSIKYSNTIARCFIDLGKVYESTRNLSNAKDAFNTALQLYIGLKDSHDHSKIIEELKNKLKELDNL